MKKQLLQESEIRKMMKFANIGALSNNFIERLEESVESGDIEEGMHAKRDDDEMDEGMHAKRDDDEMDEGMYGKRDDEELDEQEEPGAVPEEEGEEDMDMDMDMDMADDAPAPGGGDLPPEAVEKLEGLVDSLKAVLSVAGEDGQALADALSVEKEGGDMGADMDMGAEDDDMGDEAEMDPMEEDMMLEEVARRVARRLRRMKRR